MRPTGPEFSDETLMALLRALRARVASHPESPGIADRAQILQLVLRRLKTLTQQGKVRFAHRDFVAETCDQRVLAVLQVIPIMDVALLGRDRRA